MADTENVVEEERQRFLKSILSRGPHKRRIKPAENSPSLQFALDDDSSEDEDFEVPDFEPGSDEEEEDDNASNQGQESEESESDSDSESDPNGGSRATLTVGDFIEAMKKNPPFKGHAGSVTSREGAEGSKHPDILICGVCLDDVSDEGDEIVECDNCGITVHEGCYGINDEDNNSGKSSDTDSPTEAWFCDSCRAREKPPDCELCPNLGGIFKETDSGQWVHLLCALYTPGVAFVKPEKLESVTLSELTQYRWGAKDCSLCEDERFSRTGVCVSCDAGMCRTYFHITCAQMHGLLSEVPEECDEDVADPLFAHCKLHADKKATASRRRAWMAYQSRYKKREERVPTEDKTRLKKILQEARRQFQERKKKDSAKPYTPTEKVPHLLSSCPGACRQLFKKAELLGFVTKQNHGVVNVRRKWFVAPGLTCEFVNYYHDRDHRVKEMSERQEELQSNSKLLHEEEQRCRTQYDVLSDEVQGFSTSANSLREESKLLHRVLCDIGAQKFSLPDVLEVKQAEPVVSDIPAKAIEIHQCFTCKKTDNQHQMVDCDTCKNFYHLACVDPPLTRMPKKSATCLWQCSECDSSEDEEEMDVDVSDNTPISQSRQRRTIKEPAKFTPDKLELSKRIRRKRKSGDLSSEPESVKKKPKVQPKQTSKRRRSYVRVEKVVDKRSECSHCGKTGDNSTLVRCDNCKLCYHFGCLDPPVKSNPKKRGYMWYCTDCDESEEDSDEEEQGTSTSLAAGEDAGKTQSRDDKRDNDEKEKADPGNKGGNVEETVAEEENKSSEVKEDLAEKGNVKQDKKDISEDGGCKGKDEDVAERGTNVESRDQRVATRDGEIEKAKKKKAKGETSKGNLVKEEKEQSLGGNVGETKNGGGTDGNSKAEERANDSDVEGKKKDEEQKKKKEKAKEQGKKKRKTDEEDKCEQKSKGEDPSKNKKDETETEQEDSRKKAKPEKAKGKKKK